MMNFYFAVALTIGILAGSWTYGSLTFGLITWAAFIPWASFYAAGGKVEGLKKAYAANIVGVLWGFAIVYLNEVMGGTALTFSVAVAIGAAVMCIQARYIPLISFIPGAFLGTAAFFAAGASVAVLQPLFIAITIGAVLAYTSEWAGIKLSTPSA